MQEKIMEEKKKEKSRISMSTKINLKASILNEIVEREKVGDR
jgi:hypothetical protein